MANTLLTIGMITNRALMVLENNLTFSKFVNREYDDRFAMSGAKIGATLDIRIPPRYTVNTTVPLSVQDTTETRSSLVLNNQHHVDVSFTSQELTLSVDDFSNRILEPMIASLANKIDNVGLNEYWNVYNSVTANAANPPVVQPLLYDYLKAADKLDYEATPRGRQRSVVMHPGAQSALINELKGLFHSSMEIERQYEEGTMGQTGGFKLSMDQNVFTHTVGALGGTPTVNGAGQTGASIVTQSWSASITNILRRGDVITCAGCFAVNPQTRQSTGQLRNFVVTADQSSSAGGAVTIPVSPSIVTSGAGQTVTASPTNGGAVVVLGTAVTGYPQELAFHRDAFTLASADLEKPNGVDWAARVSSKKLGLSMRMVRQYDINADAFPCRVDVLYGWKTIRPELACRIWSA